MASATPDVMSSVVRSFAEHSTFFCLRMIPKITASVFVLPTSTPTQSLVDKSSLDFTPRQSNDEKCYSRKLWENVKNILTIKIK